MSSFKMVYNIRFYKSEEGRWYASLPNYDAFDEATEMVDGADVMLDVLAKGKETVFLDISNFPFENAQELIKMHEEWEGCHYMWEFPIWLCSVTLEIFKPFPDKIYFKVV